MTIPTQRLAAPNAGSYPGRSSPYQRSQALNKLPASSASKVTKVPEGWYHSLSAAPANREKNSSCHLGKLFLIKGAVL
jgi:hypothetical protein